MVEIVYNTLEIILKQFFSKKFPPFLPYDVILTPKSVLFKHLSKFLQISAFYSTIKWKLPQKQWLKLLIILRKLFWNKFFQKFFSFLALWRHLDPKTALFGHFEQLFPNCGLLRNNKWSLPHKTTIVFVHDTQVNISKEFFPQFFTILALWHHLDPQKLHFWSFWASSSRF